MIVDDRFGDPDFLQRTLADYAQGYAGIAAALWTPTRPGQSDLGVLREALVEPYRRLFTPTGLKGTGSPPAGASDAFQRWQRATQRFAGEATAIAIDASRRLAAALEKSGPDAPPVTTLAELHALWIECGEAAYVEAAHGQSFAAAQAELLSALVELRAATA
ncbi:MAG: poly(R)-hydroxyalkanoic acid synthase subunit PhaE [Steroidobacteraceae bacterium]